MNNFLVERTKKLEVELFQVRAQLERTASAKLNEMLFFQKAAFDKTGSGYEFSSPNIASSSKIVFVSPANDNDAKNNEARTKIASENLDKGKSILGAPPKVEKKKRLKTLGIRRIVTRSLNQRSRISVITMEF